MPARAPLYGCGSFFQGLIWKKRQREIRTSRWLLNGFTNVDGRISREQLQAAFQLVPNANEGVVALSQVPVAGRLARQRSPFRGSAQAWLNGKPLAIASEPKIAVELPAGEHVLAAKLDPNQLPQVLSVASQEVRFLTE